jgi:hypothetical protein
MQPQSGTQRKCFSEMPTGVGKGLFVKSDLNEVYLVTLRGGR